MPAPKRRDYVKDVKIRGAYLDENDASTLKLSYYVYGDRSMRRHEPDQGTISNVRDGLGWDIKKEELYSKLMKHFRLRVEYHNYGRGTANTITSIKLISDGEVM